MGRQKQFKPPTKADMRHIRKNNKLLTEAAKRPQIVNVGPGQPIPQGVAAADGIIHLTGNRTARKLLWRYRHQWSPVAVMVALFGIGWVAHRQAGSWTIIALLGGASTAAVWLFSRRWLDRDIERVYAAAVLLAATGWLLTASQVGVAPPMPAVLLPVGCLLAGPWWWHYRIRGGATPAVPDVSREQMWTDRVAGKDGALKGSRLVGVQELEHGWTATIVLLSGRMHTEDAIRATPLVTSAFSLPIGSVSIEATDDGKADQAKLLVIPQNPLHNVLPWPGPSLDPETGTANVGLYMDGEPVPWQFWIPGSGAVQSLVSGAPGSGKSRFLEELIAEAMLSDRVLPWIGDPQLGQSLPEWRDLVDWYVIGHEPCKEMLRATYRVMMARAADLANEEWTDDRGRARRGREAFTPSPERPLLLVLLDEAHVALKDPEVVKIVEDIGKMGRKTGVEMVLVTQVPSVAELGGSITIRSMVASGNVAVFRTGDRLSGPMAFNGALPVDPSKLPRRFPNGLPTHGLHFALSETTRPVPARSFLPGDAQDIAAGAPHTELELVAIRAAGKAYRARNDPDRSEPVPDPTLEGPALFPAPKPTARDAIVELLPADGTPIDRGNLLVAVREAQITKSISTLNAALKTLISEGRAVKVDHGLYARTTQPPVDTIVELTEEQTERLIYNCVAQGNAHTPTEIEFLLGAAGSLLESEQLHRVLDWLVQDGQLVERDGRYETTEARHG